MLTADGCMRRSPRLRQTSETRSGRPTLGRRDPRRATYARIGVVAYGTGVSWANGLIASFRPKRPDGLFTDKRHYVR